MKRTPEPLFPTTDLPPEVIAEKFQGNVEMLVQGVGRRSRRTYQRLCRIGVLPAVKTDAGYQIETNTVVAILKEENRKAALDVPFREKLIERLNPAPKKVLEMNERK